MIQNHDPSAPKPAGGRPSRAKICWNGGADARLVDACENLRLWDMQCEIDCHAELSVDPRFKHLSKVQINRKVLAGTWDLTMQKKMYKEVHKTECHRDL